MKKTAHAIKVAVLVAIWILFTGILMARDEKILEYQPISIPAGEQKSNVKVHLKHIFLKKKKTK